MDGRKFDDLARSLASSTNRRRFLRRGLAAVAAAGGLAKIAPADAARRGYSGTTSICNPDGAGGYTRISVSTGLVGGYLAAGAKPDLGCCSGAECGGDDCAPGSCNVDMGSCQATPVANGVECTPDGPVNHCRTPYTCQDGICTEGIGVLCPHISGGCQQLIGCNPNTGLCDYGPRPDGSICLRGGDCVNGTCSGGICLDPPVRECLGDACRICSYDACLDACFCYFTGCMGDPDCQSAYCDPEIGCIFESVNEGAECTSVPGGHCVNGECRSAA